MHDAPVPPDLSAYDATSFERGRSAIAELIWIIVQALFVSSWIPGSFHRRFLLKLWGAKIGHGVVIKPGVRVKFPWRLEMGDNSWIGESVWIDNLAEVVIGSNVCVSQDAYLCTGSHDWNSPTFDLIVKPIVIGDSAWVAARSTVGPGVNMGVGAVLGLGSITSKDLNPWTIYAGAPAKPIKKRKICG